KPEWIQGPCHLVFHYGQNRPCGWIHDANSNNSNESSFRAIRRLSVRKVSTRKRRSADCKLGNLKSLFYRSPIACFPKTRVGAKTGSTWHARTTEALHPLMAQLAQRTS